MVEAVIDPIRMPTLTLSEKELDDIEAMMAEGRLPPDFLERHFVAVENNVFGADHKKDKKGNPIEQGIGSAGNQTANSIKAYKKYCDPSNPKAADPDPNFAVNLKRMEAELAAANEVRAATNDARRLRARKSAARR